MSIDSLPQKRTRTSATIHFNRMLILPRHYFQLWCNKRGPEMFCELGSKQRSTLLEEEAYLDDEVVSFTLM